MDLQLKKNNMVISLNKNLYYGTNGYYQSKYPGVLEEVYNTVNAWVQYITTELLESGY